MKIFVTSLLGSLTMAEANFRFTKEMRLLRQAQFDRVYRGKAYAANETLVINAVANDDQITRLGLSVSRKVGNAVVRNKWKRIIRECFRQRQHDLPTGLDLVVRPRRGAVCDFDAVDSSLLKLAAKLDRRLQKLRLSDKSQEKTS